MAMKALEMTWVVFGKGQFSRVLIIAAWVCACAQSEFLQHLNASKPPLRAHINSSSCPPPAPPLSSVLRARRRLSKRRALPARQASGIRGLEARPLARPQRIDEVERLENPKCDLRHTELAVFRLCQRRAASLDRCCVCTSSWSWFFNSTKRIVGASPPWRSPRRHDCRSSEP